MGSGTMLSNADFWQEIPVHLIIALDSTPWFDFCLFCPLRERVKVTDNYKLLTRLFLLITGDEILELNGESMHGLTHYEALQKFKVMCLHHVLCFIRSTHKHSPPAARSQQALLTVLPCL